MYRVLYRKYRPQTFNDVYGQEHITTVLKGEITGGRISHAYLFTGTRGTGKTTCAKILSKAVNCLSPRDGSPCCECEICRGIDDGSVLDVVEIDAASNNGVDNIRDLRDASNYTPAAAKYRVYIIDEVHMLSIGAFNALLKTLEEPPEHVIFILATTEVHKLPATILSRCQRFDFRRISPDSIAARLKEVCDQEGIVITDGAAATIARLADGALRDALSLLDRCSSSGEDITEERVEACSGLAGREYLFKISSAAATRDTSALLGLVDELYAAACDMERLCEELISHYRDLMVVRTVKDPARLLNASDSEISRLSDAAKALSLPQILSALDLLQESAAAMKRGASRRTEMEMTLIRLSSPEAQTDSESMLRRIGDLENALRAGTVSVTAVPAPIEASEPKPEQTAQTPVRNIVSEPISESVPEEPKPAEPERVAEPVKTPAAPLQDSPDGTKIADWPDIVQLINKKNRLLGAQLKGSEGYIKGEFVLIDAKFSQFRDMVNGEANRKNREDIREAIASVLGRPYRIAPYTKPEKSETEIDRFGAFLEKMRDKGMEIR